MVITERTKRNLTDSTFIRKLSTLVTMNMQFTVVKYIQQDATIAFLFSAMALLYIFRATISPIIRSTYAVYGHR